MTMGGWGGEPAHHWKRRAYNLARRCEHAYQLASLINFIAFLRSGHYRSLLERVLRIRVVYARPTLARVVSFEFMNQQIAWTALSDFMLFLLPIIPFGAMIRGVARMATALGMGDSAPSAASPASAVAAAPNGGENASDAAASLRAALAAGCPCCGLSPACQPYICAPCRHVFCYYCLSGERLAARRDALQTAGARGGAQVGVAAAAEFKCPACQQIVTSQAPLTL